MTLSTHIEDLARLPVAIGHGVSSYKQLRVLALFVRPQCRITEQSPPSASQNNEKF